MFYNLRGNADIASESLRPHNTTASELWWQLAHRVVKIHEQPAYLIKGRPSSGAQPGCSRRAPISLWESSLKL